MGIEGTGLNSPRRSVREANQAALGPVQSGYVTIHDEAKGRFTPGQVVYAEWAGNDRGKVKMRLVRHYEHPAGNGWEVNIYHHHARRFSKVVQCVSDEAIARATGGAE